METQFHQRKNKIFMSSLNQVCIIFSKQCTILQGAESKLKSLGSIFGHLEPKVVTLTERVATGTYITGKNKAPKRIVCICGTTVVKLPKTLSEHATHAFEWIQIDTSGTRNVESTTGNNNFLTLFCILILKLYNSISCYKSESNSRSLPRFLIACKPS